MPPDPNPPPSGRLPPPRSRPLRWPLPLLGLHAPEPPFLRPTRARLLAIPLLSPPPLSRNRLRHRAHLIKSPRTRHRHPRPRSLPPDARPPPTQSPCARPSTPYLPSRHAPIPTPRPLRLHFFYPPLLPPPPLPRRPTGLPLLRPPSP